MFIGIRHLVQSENSPFNVPVNNIDTVTDGQGRGCLLSEIFAESAFCRFLRGVIHKNGQQGERHETDPES
jgi:hypothetical protein